MYAIHSDYYPAGTGMTKSPSNCPPLYRFVRVLFFPYLQNLRRFTEMPGHMEKLQGEGLEERLVILRVYARGPHILLGE